MDENLDTNQQREALAYFRSHASEWSDKADGTSSETVNITKQRSDFVLHVIDDRGTMESRGKTAIGDHGEWLDSEDSFQDGGAAQRIGTYLGWFLESIEAGRDCQEALSEANGRYSREVGPQYVIEGPGQPATSKVTGH
jgi:hypothetical protein